MKSRWSTDLKGSHTVSVNDGQVVYYGYFDTLEEAAEDFADSYDHNGEEGTVQCLAEDMDTGATLKFTCTP
jgi:hypothetical protein